MSQYYVEEFTPEERERLTPFVSNLDKPVFVLTGMPQVTMAALFSRYSRTGKSLRRLLLDEFLTDEGTVVPEKANAGRDRAASLFGRVLAEYGDDSVAQLGGAHVACEQVSQPLAKAIEWGRLAAYLEQSTRYVSYGDKRDGHYRYFHDPEVMKSEFAAEFTSVMDGLFDTYNELFEPVREHLDRTLPATDDAAARKRAVRALALDVMRGLLPAGAVSNVGVFAAPQSFEQMVMRLRAHPLPEARAYAEMMLQELQKSIPEFLTRLERAERGGVWVEYLRDTQNDLRAEAEKLLPDAPELRENSVALVEFTPQGEERIMAASLYAHSAVSLADAFERVSQLSDAEKDSLFAKCAGMRGNRRHKPGRGFEHCDYTFEIVSDYGAFRDLQRHRLLTVQWQELTPAHGYSVPAEVSDLGLSKKWSDAVGRAEALYLRMRPQFPQQAQYLVTLGHRLRYVMKMNAREAMHLIELRTSPQGHPSYRRVCQEMLRLIDHQAGHHRLAAAMGFAGMEDVHLPRYAAEAARPQPAQS